ncbi:MAG: T9SS type A sorting domain-containing protein [Bacteroidia bacterium]
MSLLWAQLNGTYNIDGTTNPGSFPTIKAAFDALNAQGISGPVTFIITTGYDPNSESVPMQVNAFPGMGTAEVKLTVDHNLTSVIIPTSPTTSNRFVLRLNGVKRFVVDGAGKLKFQVGSPASGTAVIGLIPTSSSTLDSVYITGCTIDGGDKTSTFAGIYLGGGTTPPTNATSGPNTRIVLERNHIYGVQNGIYLRSSLSVSDFANVIQGNKIGNNISILSWGGMSNSSGIYISGQDSIIIERDTIFNAKSSTVYGCRGITLATQSRANSRVHLRKNYIHSIEYTGTGGWQSYGMYIQIPSTGPSNIYVYNNMIANIFADGWQNPGSSGNAYGIYLFGSSTANAGVYVDFNSIHLYGTPATTYTNSNPACIGINNITGGLYLRSNLFQNTQTPPASPSRRTLIYGLANGVPASVFTELDRNVYYVAPDGSVGGGPIAALAAVGNSSGATVYSDLAAWQSFTGKDANSQELDLPAPFVSNINLHIPSGTQTPIEGAGMMVSLPSITDDFDGDTRPGNSPTPDAGCDEFNGSQPPCPSSINAGGTLNVSQDTVNRGDVVILSVSNPSNVTLPAYWQISTDGITWSNLAPFSASNHPFNYTTTQGGKLYFRVYARPPAYCTGLNPDSTNTDSLVVLSPLGEDASNPIPVNATCSTPATLTADLSTGWTDDYTGYGDRSGTVPDIFFRYILTDCLDSLKLNMCGSTMSDPDIVVWNTTKNQRIYSDGGGCGFRPQFTIVHGNVAPGTNNTVLSGPTARVDMTLKAGDTLLFVVMPWSTSMTPGPIELVITPSCGSASPVTPTLPNDTAVCFTGPPIDITISSGVTGNYTFEWYRNGQLIPGTSTLSTLQQIFSDTGTYQIVCKVLAGFCAPPGANSDTMYVTVYGLPDVSIIVNATTYPTSYDEVNVGQAPQIVTFEVDETTSPNPSQNVYTWTIQGNTQTGAGPLTVTYTSPTRDTVILHTTYGACEESDTIVVIVDPSTALNVGNETFTLYPNPSAGTFYLHSTLQGPATVQLLDLSGRLVWETSVTLQGSPIPFSVPVGDGLYQLRLQTASGKLLQQPISILH